MGAPPLALAERGPRRDAGRAPASEIVISTLREKEVALLIEWNHLMAEKDRLLRQSHGLRVAVPDAPGPAAAADAPKPGPSLMSPRRGR